MMTVHRDYDIIGKPIIVDGFEPILSRFLPDPIELPIHIIQVDIRRQGAERAALSNANFPSDFDDLFDELHDIRIEHSFGDLFKED